MRTFTHHLTPPLDRRRFLKRFATALTAGGSIGCRSENDNLGRLEKVWGRRGIVDGRFQKPRAIAIDEEDRLYIVDMLARIQVFDREGEFLRSWQTPIHEAGRPTGLSITPDGTLLVADTHYFRVLSYTLDGDLLDEATVGGNYGPAPGEFGLVTDAVRGSDGTLFVAEYGEFDRIHKYAPDGTFVMQWGGNGSQPGEFLRPQNIVLDKENHLWVADACNHRIQIFDLEGNLVDLWGKSGAEAGQLYYPYDLVLDGRGHVYVCEYGNHRIQKFTLHGKSLGTWGRNGRAPGELHNPWALVYDSRGTIHVLDSNNHRVQRIVM